MNIHVLKGGMFASKGHCIALVNEMKIAQELPWLVDEVQTLLLTDDRSPKTKAYLVSRHAVQRAAEGLTCGGAYIKVLQSGADLEKMDGSTPYGIMFGPDHCGDTNKVHFIIQHQNPVSKEWEEKPDADEPVLLMRPPTVLELPLRGFECPWWVQRRPRLKAP